MTILCRCEDIETSEGVPLDVTGVAQVMHRKTNKQKKTIVKQSFQLRWRDSGTNNKGIEKPAEDWLSVWFLNLSSSSFSFLPQQLKGRESPPLLTFSGLGYNSYQLTNASHPGALIVDVPMNVKGDAVLTDT